MVGEIVYRVEDERLRRMAAQRVRHRLRHRRQTVDGIVQLRARKDGLAAVVGDGQRDMLMTEVATGGRVRHVQDGEVMHMRRVHHRTDHETARSLRRIGAVVLQIVERGVPERGLHLVGEVVAGGRHLQAHIELTRHVGQSEVPYRYHVPCVLLERVEGHHIRGRDDLPGRIGHKGLEAPLPVRDIALVIIVLHIRDNQFLAGPVPHTRTDDRGVVARLQHRGGRVRIVRRIVVGDHAPVHGVVRVVLVVAGTNLHILHLVHLHRMVRERHQRLLVAAQHRYRHRVAVRLRGSRNRQIDIDVGLRLTPLVTDQSAIDIPHRVFRRRLALRVYLRHRHIVVVQVPQTDTVDVYVVALLRIAVEGDIDTARTHVIAQIVRV